MTPELRASCWPMERAGDALSALARACGLSVDGEPPGRLPLAIASDRGALERWLDAASRSLHLEVEPFRPAYGKIEEALADAGPVLLTLSEPSGRRSLLAVVHLNGARAQLLGPDGELRRARVSGICAALRDRVSEDDEKRVDTLLDRAGVSGERRVRARDAILGEQLAGWPLDSGWKLSLPPSASFARQIRDAGLPRRAAAVIALQIATQLLTLSAWWLVGRGALEGRLEKGWLVAWALLLTTMIPVRVVAAWLQGAVALDFSVLLKRRMLFGALRLEPEETRHQGSGQLLGRVIEAEAVESLITGGGIASVLAIVQLLVAGVVLGDGPGGAGSVLLLVAVVLVAAGTSWLYLRRLRTWTEARLAMTNDLVERMVGHRTRLAQEPRETWHEAEDHQLSAYADGSAALDRLSAAITVIPRVWMVTGLLSIASALIDRRASATSLAVGLGGIVLAYGALSRLTAGAASLFGAHVAWGQAGPLFNAGGREEPAGRASLVAAALQGPQPGALVEARDLSYRYQGRREPVLRNISVRIGTRDRLLLQGPSGGGKSTLGGVLSGIRAPESGLLLLGGLDARTLGARGWRRRIVAAPQFHENHVLTATFAFNLLMGRGWPARPADIDDAVAVCGELGLAPLLQRMPAGLMQMVGETGWQLSHGERSRLFIARALLQNADMIVLDESFAALDPETLERALRCVLARAKSLVVIAHP